MEVEQSQDIAIIFTISLTTSEEQFLPNMEKSQDFWSCSCSSLHSKGLLGLVGIELTFFTAAHTAVFWICN